jgi:Tfp pilus assembly protein PilO
MKKYFLTIVNFLFGFIIIVSLIVPKYEDFQGLKKELAGKKIDLQNKLDYFANLKTLKEKLGKYEEGLAKIDSSLPSDPSMPSLLDFLQKTASQQGLVLQKLGFGQTAIVLGGLPVMKKEVSFQADGLYPSFKKFVLDLEKSSRLIQVESLSFSFPEKKEIFSFSLVVSANFLPEPSVTYSK